MDRVDALIFVLLFLAILRGMNLGFLRLLFSTIGFGIGLFIGSIITVKLFESVEVSSQSQKALIVLLIETVFGICFSLLLELVAIHLTKKSQGLRVSRVDQVFGGIFEAISVVVLVWLVAPSLTNVQTYKLGYYVRNSFIVTRVDQVLPSPPGFIATLENIVNPNNFPNVFVGSEPQHTTIQPNATINNTLILQDESSVVKVEGKGCGGLVEGSGFVTSTGFVVTNAHVIAGIKDPSVIDQSGTFTATPVYFNPNLDLAVLRVPGLTDSPLKISSSTLVANDAVVALGFPNNGPLVAQTGGVIDEVNAQGQNIYNEGNVNREIYEIQADIQPGNSGGPLIAADGSVAGIVFAKSVDQNNVGYALVISDATGYIQNAVLQNQASGDGQCTSD